MHFLTLWMLLAANPAQADFTKFCGSTIEQVRTDTYEKQLALDDTRRLWRSIGNVHPADQGRLLREEAERAGVTTCPLAELLDVAAGLDPITGCEPSNDVCAPRVFDRAFAVAFEKRTDRATRRVHVNLRAGAPLVIPSELKSVTQLSVMADDGTIDLTPLAALPGLTDLALAKMAVAGFESLGKLPQLKKLIIGQTRLSAPLDFAFVGKLTRLRVLEVSLSKEAVTAKTPLAPLAALTELEVLKLVGVRADGCAPIAKLSKLKELQLPGRVKGESKSLFGTVVQFEESGGDASCVARLTRLERLSLVGLGLTDLRPLAGLTQLTSLDLDWNRGLVDLRPLAGLKALTSLSVGHSQVVDLAPLKGLTALNTLLLSDTPVADLTPVKGLTQLSQLGLRSTKVKSLAPLHGLKALFNVSLPDLSAEERAAFQAVVPRAHVQ